MLGSGGFRGHGRRRRTGSSPSRGSFRKLEVVLLDLRLDSAHGLLIFEQFQPDTLYDLLPDRPKHTEPLLLTAGSLRRVLKRPVQPSNRPREDRASLVSLIADGDDVAERLTEVPFQSLRPLPRDIDPELAHHFNSLRPYSGSVCTSTMNLEAVPSKVS